MTCFVYCNFTCSLCMFIFQSIFINTYAHYILNTSLSTTFLTETWGCFTILQQIIYFITYIAQELFRFITYKKNHFRLDIYCIVLRYVVVSHDLRKIVVLKDIFHMQILLTNILSSLPVTFFGYSGLECVLQI